VHTLTRAAATMSNLSYLRWSVC